ncbi:helix-turn-helix transcriptional regulator [Clostridium perfringens]|uniref:helix-turn-helix domain-containing protein n=1 Tax=Clostridium perfringens TaxID=1502 RepID=UPI0029409D12|nr:helix-turn-helix transcriptional regulator [Clostridium perfringens]MDV5112711.1 helix-turn-helix transcriptional regulator [Clostridium perfringens]
MSIGKKLREIRRSKGFTMKELSNKSKVSQSYISDLENEKNNKPSIDILNKLAKALEVPITDLFNLGIEEEKSIKKAENILNNFIPNNNDTEKALNSFKYLLDYLYINWRQNSTDEDLTNMMNSKMLYDILVNLIDLYSKKH